jgi:hypothetical protein
MNSFLIPALPGKNVMPPLRCCATVLALTLASMSSMTGFAAEANTSKETAKTEVSKQIVPVPPEVQQALQKRGYARIIIGLNVGFQPEGELAPEEVKEQRAQIARSQEKFLAGLKNTRFPLDEEKFATVPYLVIYVNEAVLQYVVKSPLVKSIEVEGADVLYSD